MWLKIGDALVNQDNIVSITAVNANDGIDIYAWCVDNIKYKVAHFETVGDAQEFVFKMIDLMEKRLEVIDVQPIVNTIKLVL